LDASVVVQTVLVTALQEGTILLLAALGEIFAERSGVLNLGVEGMMDIGATVAVLVVIFTGNFAFAVSGAILAGLIFSLLHGFISIHLKANQIVSGLAISILGLGLSNFIGREAGITGSVIPHLSDLPIPGLSGIPVIGPAFFDQNIIVYMCYAGVVILWFVLFKTRLGLNIRTVGENPYMADSLGVSVYRVRYLCVAIGGVLAGLAGSAITLGYYPYTEAAVGMAAGRGWIAVGLVILATWSPFRAFLGAILFGAVSALPYSFHSIGFELIPSNILQMLPFALTLAVLVAVSFQGLRKRVAPPAALGLPYSREE
jgi:ABC-type uncharacterized transport system permease subunit